MLAFSILILYVVIGFFITRTTLAAFTRDEISQYSNLAVMLGSMLLILFWPIVLLKMAYNSIYGHIN